MNVKGIIRGVAVLLLLTFSVGAFGCGSISRRSEVNSTITKDTPLVLESPPNEKDIYGESRLSFAAAGDNIIHEAVFTDAKNRAAVYASSGGKRSDYRFVDMFDGISDIVSDASLAYINHETPVAGDSFGISGYPDFNAPDEVGDDLAEVGFDIINIANNHMLDMGESGYRNSIEYWNSKDTVMIGGYTKADYDSIKIIDKGGVKIALLAYTTFINDAHKGKVSATSDLVVPYASEAVIKRQTSLARNAGADIIIVSIHWGTEGKFTPNNEQKKYARLLADCGVDVVIGNHSHTLQPIEWIDGSEGNKTLVAYSLGNCLSTMLYSYYMVGGILTFDIVKDDSGAFIEKPLLVPTVCHYSMTRDSLQIYKLEDYSSTLASAHGAQKNGAFTLATLKGYVTDTVDKQFLPDFLK